MDLDWRMQDDADEWKWTDGSEWTVFNPWGPGQPDNPWGKDDHLGMNYPRAGEWNDFSGDYPQGSICQYDPSQTEATYCAAAGIQCWDPETYQETECCEGFCAGYLGYLDTSEPGYCVSVTTSTSTCSPVGAQCTLSGLFDLTGFEDGSICSFGPGQTPATTEPFYCIEY